MIIKPKVALILWTIWAGGAAIFLLFLIISSIF